jgi:hypothetical protein
LGATPQYPTGNLTVASPRPTPGFQSRWFLPHRPRNSRELRPICKLSCDNTSALNPTLQLRNLVSLTPVWSLPVTQRPHPTVTLSLRPTTLQFAALTKIGGQSLGTNSWRRTALRSCTPQWIQRELRTHRQQHRPLKLNCYSTLFPIHDEPTRGPMQANAASADPDTLYYHQAKKGLSRVSQGHGQGVHRSVG